MQPALVKSDALHSLCGYNNFLTLSEELKFHQSTVSFTIKLPVSFLNIQFEMYQAIYIVFVSIQRIDNFSTRSIFGGLPTALNSFATKCCPSTKNVTIIRTLFTLPTLNSFWMKQYEFEYLN